MQTTVSPLRHPSDKAMSQSTNNDGGVLAGNMKRLSLSAAAATALPSSSPVTQSMASPNGHGTPATSGLKRPTKSPLRRAPSSSSIGSIERSITPTLHKRTSLNSLQGVGAVTPTRSPMIRRTSSNFASSPSTSMGARSSLPPATEEPFRPPPTSTSVARNFFEKELESHQVGLSATQQPQAVAILQDDCYGHRFSRPRTSRANLSTIVERPERIHASVLGLATAYVRLGGRHADGHAAPHPSKLPPSLPPPPFRIQKTARRLPLRSPAVTAIHGAQWMNELAQMCDAAESKLALSGKELTRPSATGQNNGGTHIEKPKLHDGDLYLCSESLKALEGALGGVCEGVDSVFKDQGPKRAFVCIRPPGHHCSADMPSGFCWLNNVHVGIGHAVLTHGLTHAAIIDFDLHHGDGSQSITWAHNSRVASMPKNVPMSKKAAIGYFSLHDINSYPCEMGDDEKIRNASVCLENAHGQSIWNVHLQSWKTEAEFWQLYEEKYSVILTKARDFLRHHTEKLRQAPTHPEPKAAIFLSAGFDASEWETPSMQRHQVNVPTSFYARLTRDVVSMAEEEGLGVGGRIISVLEGGYSDRALMSGVLSHMSGLTVSTGHSRQLVMGNRQGQEMSRRLEMLNINGDSLHGLANGTTKGGIEPLDLNWWSLPQLEELETLVNPQAPVTAPKKQRSDVRPTYTSATQSYTAKIVSPPQGRRSFSGSGAGLHHMPTSRPPSPPPPDVNWGTAAHELSKLLVPSDRETRSCKPEDLNAEASRSRRDRYSTVGLPTSIDTPVTDAKRMQLRDRKGKTAHHGSDQEKIEEEKLSSRTNRRKTIADVSLLAGDIESESILPNNQPQPGRHTRRRSSIASNASSMTAEQSSDFGRTSATDKREPLVIKKPRAPPNPRSEGAKPKPVKKQHPVPRFPSTSSTTTILEDDRGSMLSAQEDTKAGLSINEDHESKEVNHLVSSMRTMSIKLHVPPRQEYEARENKSKPASKGRPPKTAAPRKAPKTSTPTKAEDKAIRDQSPPMPTESVVLQQLPHPEIDSGSVQDTTMTATPPVSGTPLQPAFTETSATIPSSPAPSSNQPFIPASENPAETFKSSSPSVPNQEEIKTDTPKQALQSAIPAHKQSPKSTNPNTPVTVKRARQDLPVFTATSPISFAKPNVLPSGIDQTIQQGSPSASGPTQDPLPPSPGVAYPTPPAHAQSPMPREQQHPIDNPTRKTTVKIEEEPQPSDSIWDVPDTPQPPKASKPGPS